MGPAELAGWGDVEGVGGCWVDGVWVDGVDGCCAEMALAASAIAAQKQNSRFIPPRRYLTQ